MINKKTINKPAAVAAGDSLSSLYDIVPTETRISLFFSPSSHQIVYAAKLSKRESCELSVKTSIKSCPNLVKHFS